MSDAKEKHEQDPILLEFKSNVYKQRVLTFEQGVDGVLKYQGKLCLPILDGQEDRIMKESYSSRYSIHPDSTKMYRNLREVYWWNGMKKGIAEFFAKCKKCQHVKMEHQRLGGLAQYIKRPKWMWDMINMDSS